MPNDAKIQQTDRERLLEVINHLPCGPFTVQDFVDHAMGLNAVSNISDVEPLLDSLAESGVIHRVGPTIAMWVVPTD